MFTDIITVSRQHTLCFYVTQLIIYFEDIKANIPQIYCIIMCNLISREAQLIAQFLFIIA